MDGLLFVSRTVFSCVLCLFFLVALPACAEEKSGGPVEDLAIVSAATGEERLFRVEIAATPEAQERGLMFRKSMPADHGMLFVFDRQMPRSFWMKNTYIPLDILFIRADGTIHHIARNAVPLDETPVPSNGPVMHVLEINGGVAQMLGIREGDKVRHPVFAVELVK